jgi:hypothetical protein
MSEKSIENEIGITRCDDDIDDDELLDEMKSQFSIMYDIEVEIIEPLLDDRNCKCPIDSSYNIDTCINNGTIGLMLIESHDELTVELGKDIDPYDKCGRSAGVENELFIESSC